MKEQQERENIRTILGVRFSSAPAKSLIAAGISGGLTVVPSAPVLVAMESNLALRSALLDADLAIADSGLMVLLWRILKREKITRVSGLEYLKLLIQNSKTKKAGRVFWVLPNEEAKRKLLEWARRSGFPDPEQDSYIAPNYRKDEVVDAQLLVLLNRSRPEQVILCVGGGVQEILGFHLKHALDYRPGIHCIGAAIGFLTGDQVRIPRWADYIYLGWFFRCLSNPRKFFPRYWKATRLVLLILRHGDKAPAVCRTNR